MSDTVVLDGQLHPTLQQLYRLDARCDDGDTQFEYAVGYTGRQLIKPGRPGFKIIRIVGVGSVAVEGLGPIPEGMRPDRLHVERLVGGWFVNILLKAKAPPTSRREITFGEAPFDPDAVWRRP